MTNTTKADDSSEGWRTGILVESVREALRIAERYLFISLATAAVAAAAPTGEAKEIHLFVVDIKLEQSFVQLAALYTSWAAAWLSWAHVRHAASLTRQIRNPNEHLPYNAAVAALTHPSLFTMKQVWLRWIIITVMALLILKTMLPDLMNFPTSWYLWSMCVFVEAPFFALLVSSGLRLQEPSAKT